MLVSGVVMSAYAAAVDVVVYGATPAGIQASLAAAKEGATVVLLSPVVHVGGMMTSGLGATDVGNPAAIGGASKDFFQRVGAKYDTNLSFKFEPHVGEEVFMELLAAEPNVQLVVNATLTGAAKTAGGVVESVTTAPTWLVEAGDSPAHRAAAAAAATVWSASFFIDAS